MNYLWASISRGRVENDSEPSRNPAATERGDSNLRTLDAFWWLQFENIMIWEANRDFRLDAPDCSVLPPDGDV